ncbi:Membrane protein involved in the export of O-antigen and teichoic acid [Ectothiorhodospira mobilis]|uniref:Membrane protein involved in the export of O-antigen and teichoic acid n=1 Tax=Ectothiorhodospira mobilis TaxID=195064 RepID=A0A1I4RJG2_ECTMO|nr:Membrane protein involved in the export of O-antigen and teichoic acid [Ectothiorhodospira mobilis]
MPRTFPTWKHGHFPLSLHPAPSGLARKLLQGGAGSLLAQGLELALSLLVTLLLARLLGPSGYGVYAFVLAAVSLISLPVQLGLPPLIVRETARGHTCGDWPTVRGIWRWSHGVTLGLSLLGWLGGVVVLGFWVQDPVLRSTLLLGLVLVPLLALSSLRAAGLRGLGRVLLALLPEQVIRPGLMGVLLLLALIAWPHGVTPAGAMAVHLLAACVAFAVGGWLLYRSRPPHWTAHAPVYRPRAWLAAAWPMALTQGFGQINRHADVILLGLLAATVDVGVYRVAAQGAFLVSMGLTALNMVTAPYIIRLHAQGARHKLQKLARRTAQAALAFALLALAGYVVLGPWLLQTLFGPAFAAAYLPLLILACGQVVNAGFGSVGLLLTMTGHERQVSRVVGVAALVNVALNLALIPLLGTMGAALATSAGTVLWNVWLWFVVRERLGIRSAPV